MKNTIVLAIFFQLLTRFSDAQISKACIAIGGVKNEFGYAAHETNDSGYVVIGHAGSYSNNASDFYIVKLDKDMNMQWSQNYAGGEAEGAYAGDQTFDGGYFFAGYTNSFSFYNKMYIAKL